MVFSKTCINSSKEVLGNAYVIFNYSEQLGEGGKAAVARKPHTAIMFLQSEKSVETRDGSALSEELNFCKASPTRH